MSRFDSKDSAVDNVLRWLFAAILVCGGLSLLGGFLANAASGPGRMLFILVLTAFLAVGFIVVFGLIAESTRKLVTHPFVLWVGVLVLLITKLLIG